METLVTSESATLNKWVELMNFARWRETDIINSLDTTWLWELWDIILGIVIGIIRMSYPFKVFSNHILDLIGHKLGASQSKQLAFDGCF